MDSLISVSLYLCVDLHSLQFAELELRMMITTAKKGAWVGRQKKRTTWITHPGLLKTIQRILVLINAITHRTVTNATPTNIIVVSWSDNIIFTLKSIKLLTYMKSILTNTGAKLAHCLRTHKSFWSDLPLLFVFLTWINSFNFLYVESS